MNCPHCPQLIPKGYLPTLMDYCDVAITEEYYRRIRAKKAKSVAAGGPRGGWPKGKKRKL